MLGCSIGSLCMSSICDYFISKTYLTAGNIAFLGRATSPFQEIPSILRYLKGHYRFHKSQPLVPTLGQINRTHFNIILPPTPVFQVVSSSDPQTLYVVVVFLQTWSTFPAHHILLNFITPTAYDIMKLPITQFSPASCFFFTFLNALFSNTLQPISIP